jgi:hypothetical protein
MAPRNNPRERPMKIALMAGAGVLATLFFSVDAHAQ